MEPFKEESGEEERTEYGGIGAVHKGGVATHPEFLVKLSHSMNKRCKQVVEHKGHRTTF